MWPPKHWRPCPWGLWTSQLGSYCGVWGGSTWEARPVMISGWQPVGVKIRMEPSACLRRLNHLLAVRHPISTLFRLHWSADLGINMEKAQELTEKDVEAHIGHIWNTHAFPTHLGWHQVNITGNAYRKSNSNMEPWWANLLNKSRCPFRWRACTTVEPASPVRMSYTELRMHSDPRVLVMRVDTSVPVCLESERQQTMRTHISPTLLFLLTL